MTGSPDQWTAGMGKKAPSPKHAQAAPTSPSDDTCLRRPHTPITTTWFSSHQGQLKRCQNQPDWTMTTILYVVDDQRGSHIGAEVMMGICCEPEVAVYQGHKGQGLFMG